MKVFIDKHMEAMEGKKTFLEKQMKKARLNVLWMETFADEVQNSIEYHLKHKFGESQKCSHESVPDIQDYISRITDW